MHRLGAEGKRRVFESSLSMMTHVAGVLKACQPPLSLLWLPSFFVGTRSAKVAKVRSRGLGHELCTRSKPH